MTDDILMPHYSSLPLAVDGDGLLSNTAALGFQDDLQSLLHVTKLSSDVMLTDDRHSLLMPTAELDALDTLQLVGAHQPTSACEIDADDFLLDDADWSSVQVLIMIISTCSLLCQIMPKIVLFKFWYIILLEFKIVEQNSETKFN